MSPPLVIGLLAQILLVLTSAELRPPEVTCRDRNGHWDLEPFRLLTCATCYGYLFPNGKELQPFNQWLVSLNGTTFPHRTVLLPDIQNASRRADVCRTLNTDECVRWEECCLAAEACCRSQQDIGSGHADRETGRDRRRDDETYCPETWDGYACWRDTSAGSTVSTSCPGFIEHAVPTVNAYKTCTTNGTWYKDPATQLEWTNFTSCLSTQNIKHGIYINVACNSVSLLLLIPAVAIFLSYRHLRTQHRIRLHIHLFCSFMATNIIFILWDLLIVYNRLVSPATESRMRANTPGCKMLYILTRYSRSCNFLWMFFEGYYLHRLIVKAFEPPSSLVPFYILAWGFPWFPVIAYSVMRALYADESCWVQSFDPYEWLIYVPNLSSLAMNVFFLINILRILLSQLQAHPNEPSNYRRALKATFILVPLFGIQLIFIIYRPPTSVAGATNYAVFESVVTHSQGFFVALVFCFLNGEVLTHLRRTVSDFKSPVLTRESKVHCFSASPAMTSTQTNHYCSATTGTEANLTDTNRQAFSAYIPLKVLKEAKGGDTA